jgi:hypothetical protein
MRGYFLGGGLSLLLLVGCGSQATPATNSTGCAAGTAHHAYVVVQHLDGVSIQRCVGFSGAYIDGQSIMDQSGIEYQARSVSSGKVVCQVDLEPSQVSECFPQNGPYWALFIESGGRWSSAPAGYTDVQLHDGDSLGWHYVWASDPSPAPPPLPR